MKANGSFDVKLQPLDAYATGEAGTTLGRMSIDKTFQGDLAATSQGEMLSAISPAEESAGYVAIEQVSGTLHGKQGTFILQHFGITNAAESRLVLEVVPDSGTGELASLTGKMMIQNQDGKHTYQFDYFLAS